MFVDNDILFPQIADLLASGQKVTLTPTGNSMEPFIHGGADSVTLSRADSASLRVGDILLVHLPTRQYVLHRLIRISGDNLTLRGDGNIVGEERCRKADVLGRVIEIRSAGGRRKPLTRAACWQLCYPVRKWLLKAHRKLRRWFHKIQML